MLLLDTLEGRRPMSVPIQISAWNIHGFKSAIIGDKLSDESFLNEVKNDDIIALTETHNNDKNDSLSIPGYRRVKIKNRKKTNNSNKDSGGLALFAKPEIFKFITPINNTNEDTIWIRIKKEILDQKQDIYIGTVYLPPHKNNNDSSKKILELFEEIMAFQKKGEVIVQGDFNARTSVISDTIAQDRFDTILMGKNNGDIKDRNSQDKVSDFRGKELIELCKSLEMAILNGRKIGDIYGKFTSLQWNGNSVVDYVIVSQSIYSSISYFKIGDYVPWLSDHCATRFKLKSCLPKENLSRVENPREVLASLYWHSEESPEKFTSILRAHEPEIREILSTPDTNILEKFQNLIKTVVEEGKFRKENRKKRCDDAPWFDKDCKEAKLEIKKAGKNIQNAPSDPSLRKILTDKKKLFRKMTREKKRVYETTIFDDMLKFDQQKESKKFWTSLKKLNNEKEADYISCISHDSWVNHFRKIRTSDRDPVYPPDDENEGPLDYEISLEELDDSSGVLKNGKKWGADLVSYEMLKCIKEYNPRLLLKVLNYTLLNNVTAYEWFISIIAPIHKKGSKMDPDNYRGISLISCLYKLLTAILNKRLVVFCKENSILSPRQLGFVSGNRTSDAHFVLNNLIKDYCHNKGERLYSCFVDFSKAFDCIPRDILFEKLRSKGITGKVFNLIKNIYMNEKCQVKIGQTLSEAFDANQGVRQGCILSPLLFNIFISELPEILDKDENEPAMIGNHTKISSILWADDLVMISKSKEGLTKMLHDLSKFSAENGLKINADKTKCMIFNKTGRHIRCTIKCQSMTLETVREYKYLGFLVTPSGEVTSGILDLKSRALFAFVQLKKKLGNNFRNDVHIAIYLFDTLIKPIILYCSDFWAILKIDKKKPCELLPKKNLIDSLHTKFLKQLLGLQTQTHNIGVFLETGRIPLMAFAIKNCIKNWNRIAIEKNCNPIVQLSYENMLENGIEWCKNIKLLLGNLGLNYILNGDVSNPEVVVHKRITDVFLQNAFTEISKEGSKLRTYCLLKKEARREPYLKSVKNVKDRISMTKFRLSNHELMIEKGRHLKLEINERNCSFCNSLEDELHFLIDCPTYAPLRCDLFNAVEEKLNDVDFKSFERNTMLKYLLGNVEIAPLVAKYLCKTLELRKFLVDNPKRLF